MENPKPESRKTLTWSGLLFPFIVSFSIHLILLCIFQVSRHGSGRETRVNMTVFTATLMPEKQKQDLYLSQLNRLNKASSLVIPEKIKKNAPSLKTDIPNFSQKSKLQITRIASDPAINPSVLDTPVFYTYDEVTLPPVISQLPDIDPKNTWMTNTTENQILVVDLYIDDQGLVIRIDQITNTFDRNAGDYLLSQLKQIHFKAAQKEGSMVAYRMRLSYSAGVLAEIPLENVKQNHDPLVD